MSPAPTRSRSRSREERRPERAQRAPPVWTPRTELGRKVASGQITSLDQILNSGTRILEPQIIDVLLPDLKENVLEVTSTQRMTAYGRKQQMRAIVVMGNTNGYISVGVGKATESRDAITEAITDAKKRLVKVQLGCSSWECGCGTLHSITRTTSGKSSSTHITLKPAPRGVGIVANETAKAVLELAGVKDVWTSTKGRTRNVLNMVLATVHALDHLNHLKNESTLKPAADTQPA